VPEGTPPEFKESAALDFHVHAVAGRARAGTLHLAHGPVHTPVYAPVGTKGSVKAVTSEQLESHDLCNNFILANTYHLALHPGMDLLQRAGGLHQFMSFRGNILTDSGGFQMVSLTDLAHVTEQGVRFTSPTDGTEMLLTPEESIRCQNIIGADIIMQLDDVVSAICTDQARFDEATQRSVRWLDRCMAAHARPREQALFAIVQGGLDVSPGGMRERCLEGMLQRNTPGYAIGGLAGGEDKTSFWTVVEHNAARLPSSKPRYLMGVGYALDIVVCVALGVDMFDCVFPTRTARFGGALTRTGQLKLKSSTFRDDLRPVDEACGCPACRSVSRAYLHSLFKADAPQAAQLLTMHNLTFMRNLMGSMRAAILAGEAAYRAWVLGFLRDNFPGSARDVPEWVRAALATAGIPVPDEWEAVAGGGGDGGGGGGGGGGVGGGAAAGGERES